VPHTKSQIVASLDEQYVREIARVLHAPDSQWRTIAVLEGFFDDSGTHQGSLVTAMGGCVSRAEQWAAFAPEWRRVLDDFGVSFFHSTDLANSQEEYKNWDDSRKRSFITRLARVMGDYAKTAIAGLVVVDDYSIVPEWARKTSAFGDQYNFCFQMCVGLTMNWIDGLNPPMPQGDQVAFTFDQRPKGEGLTRNAYYYIKKFRDPNDRMGTLAFADKKRLLPLQAADFVAYESYKHLDNQERASGRPLRGSLAVLVENVWQFEAYVFRAEDLKELLDYYQQAKNIEGKEPWWPWHKAQR
jgi:hypothetical protein